MTDMTSQTVLISGATAGIGLETARGLAKMGAHVVIIGRSQNKTIDVVADLKRTTGNENIEYLLADLALMSEVRRVAADFKAKYDRLDVLVNNVGAIFNSRKVSSEGIEMTWALNHLGYFVLTQELLDVLKASAPARIVNVSSDAHRSGKIRWDDPEMSKKFSVFPAYSQSKLANIMFTFELARRLEGTGVIANVLHPGLVASNFAVTNNPGIFNKVVRRVLNLFSISSEEGAQTSIYLASSPKAADITGEYFVKSKIVQPIDAAKDVSAQQRLWELTEARLAQLQPEFA